MKIEVYSDGSATVASKPGGWGFVVVFDGVKVHEGYGHMELASNNDAELEAAIQGLAYVLKMRIDGKIPVDKHEVFLVSDSEIVLGWTSGTYRFKQKAKMHKYHQLRHVVNKLGVKTRWVAGHTGDEHNERCDKLANMGRKMQTDPIPEQKPSKKSKKEISYRWNEHKEFAIWDSESDSAKTLMVTPKEIVQRPGSFHKDEILSAVCSILAELIELQERKSK